MPVHCTGKPSPYSPSRVREGRWEGGLSIASPTEERREEEDTSQECRSFPGDLHVILQAITSVSGAEKPIHVGTSSVSQET